MPAPTMIEVAAYLESTSGDLSWENTDLADALAAETAAQARVCRVPAAEEEWPSDLAEALMRRVARNLAMRGIPLGAQPSISEIGVGTFRPGSDSEVRRLEAPWRRLVVG